VPRAGVLRETFKLGKRTLEGPSCAHEAENERVGRLWKLAEHDRARVQHGRRIARAEEQPSISAEAGPVTASSSGP
jgi:hypothetical protein